MTRFTDHRGYIALVLAVVAVAGISACGIASDDTPRDIPIAEQVELGSGGDRAAGAATGTARVYLLSPEVVGQAELLESVARDVAETPIELLKALLAGPNAAELANQFRTALPVDTELLGARRQGFVLHVDLSEEVLRLSGQILITAIAQIVFTAAELDGVRGVAITVDGADQPWPVGNGELQSTPLTVYDYPGLVPSSQPDYPAFPSPSVA
ncbi:MAG: GerMN domain-containing protein [Actinobacteria bacterium]|nr:GerMN domain-containing protein [Actinomycetota bacterium]